MNATLKLNPDDLQRDIENQLGTVTSPAENAMAQRFWQITRSNFGYFGIDRPYTWPPLSARYSRKVGRTVATLIVSGHLRDSVHIEDGNKVVVNSDDCPYALAHAYGSRKTNLPPRMYFPIDAQGQPLPWTAEQLAQAAQAKINSLL
jgi:phage gpG-like protein